MKNLIATAAVLTAVFATPVTHAQAVVGQAAPTFQATDVNGKTVQLSDYAGKHVVLEWFNPGCPFVQKHYNSGNMAATQKAAVSKGWSGSPSTPTRANQATRRRPPLSPPGLKTGVHHPQPWCSMVQAPSARPTALAQRRTCT